MTPSDYNYTDLLRVSAVTQHARLEDFVRFASLWPR